MDTNKPIAGVGVLVAGALVIGAGLAAGGGVWLLEHRSTATAERRVRTAEAGNRRLERRIDELEADLSSATAALARARTPQPDAEPVDDQKNDPPAKAEKHIGYVVKAVRDGGEVSLVVDYAELLTGEDASTAHVADGLGPIDGEQFYIRNVNSKQRTLQVAPDPTVVVWSWFAETEDVGAKEIPLDRFFDAMRGGASPDKRLYEMPYWFTVSGGAVTRIEEQFLP